MNLVPGGALFPPIFSDVCNFRYPLSFNQWCSSDVSEGCCIFNSCDSGRRRSFLIIKMRIVNCVKATTPLSWFVARKMAKIVKTPESLSSILLCEHCSNLKFKHVQDFVRWVRLFVYQLFTETSPIFLNKKKKNPKIKTRHFCKAVFHF